MMPNRFRSLRLGAAFIMAGLTALLRAEDYSITTFAGQGNVVTGVDGTPGSFNNPYGVAIDAQKNIYVTDTLNNTIRKISPAGAVTTLAGTAGSPGSANGTGAAARFNFPVGVAVDASGNVFVADSRNFTIRKITPAGEVTTYAGAPFQTGSVDGPAASARFFLPYGVAVDGGGNVYVADGGNHTIRKIAPDGTVSTLAGTAQASGYANASGSAARFNTPWGLSVDASNNVYVADSGNHAIRRITPAGVVTTVAGSPTTPGTQDGPAASARFEQPRGVAVDGAGNVYVADSGKSVLRHITPGGVVSTLAGTSGIVGEINSVGASARFYDPNGIVSDGATVYIADTSNNVIRRGTPASQASLPDIVAQPLEQEVAVGQSVTISVGATGTNLAYQWLKNNVVIPGATSSNFTIAAAQLSDVGAYKARVSSGSGGPSVDSQQANLSVAPIGTGAIVITARPLNQSVAVGANVTLSVTATGAGLTYQWLLNGAALTGATSATYNIPSAQTANAGTYSVRLTSGAAVETVSAKLTVGGSGGDPSNPIAITTQPSSKIVEAGSTTTFSVVATGSNLTYQWYLNGAAISGATSADLTISSAQSANAGTYFVRVSSGPTSQDSVAVTLVINGDPGPGPGPGGPTARLSNLSVRTTLAANQILIVGATVSGGASNILVRAAGPALAAFGLPTAMADPKLQLFNGQTLALENNDWAPSLAATFTSVGAFAFPEGSKDAAFVRSIEGGPTIQASGPTGGVLLVEAYDLSTSGNARLVNVSARNFVGTDDNILIAGVVVAGTGTKRLLVRAVGPKLATFGVTGTIADPKLEIYNSTNAKISENDNWAGSLAPTFASVGAFALDAGSLDAAVVVDLAPGSYTVQMSGVARGTGEGLIEVYELP